MDTSSWQSLLGLDVRRSGDEAIVGALLERLRRAGGWRQAGLYLDGGDGESRRLVAGEGELPVTAEEAGVDFESLGLPNAWLVYRPGADGRQPEKNALVALVAAIDAWRLRHELEREEGHVALVVDAIRGPGEGDRECLRLLQNSSARKLMVLNKIDRVRPKAKLLPMMQTNT